MTWEKQFYWVIVTLSRHLTHSRFKINDHSLNTVNSLGDWWCHDYGPQITLSGFWALYRSIQWSAEQFPVWSSVGIATSTCPNGKSFPLPTTLGRNYETVVILFLNFTYIPNFVFVILYYFSKGGISSMDLPSSSLYLWTSYLPSSSILFW